MSSRLERVDPASIPFASAPMVAMFAIVNQLYLVVPLASLSWSRDPSVELYTLLVTTADNRSHEATMAFNPTRVPDPNPTVSITTSGSQWSQTECLLLRQLQDAFISIRNIVRATVVDVSWLSGSMQAQVTASPGTVSPGDPVTAGWANPSAGAVDWIGLFAAGADPHAWISYVYVSSQSMGSHVFTAPSTPGAYEFRYLLNNGYISIATSVAFTVT